MIKILRWIAPILMAASLSGCVFYGHPHDHRHWYGPQGGHPGYWR
jgi:hypothetical protein